jgi:ketosteroid isomerase-like protein
MLNDIHTIHNSEGGELMTKERLETWMAALGRAWETGDADAAAALFREDINYQEDPFAPPLQGREAVREYWADVPRTQKDIRFSFETLAVTQDGGIFHWWASFTRIPSGAPVRLDGAQTVKLDDDNLCYSLREWWMREEVRSEE